MPPRIARSSLPTSSAPKTNRNKNKNKKRSLDAYAAASKQIGEKQIPRHRLGEEIDDEPRSKKRKTDTSKGKDTDGSSSSTPAESETDSVSQADKSSSDGGQAGADQQPCRAAQPAAALRGEGALPVAEAAVGGALGGAAAGRLLATGGRSGAANRVPATGAITAGRQPGQKEGRLSGGDEREVSN